ncbi:MAG: TatD family hydrolase [Ruminococcus sp.]|nr:TatD family hydrolase [Ruminococcus sp.]
MLTNIFDAHCHYDDEWFNEDREELLKSLPECGVSGVVCNAVDLKSAEVIKGYAEKYPYIYFTAGFHPENLENIPSDYKEQIAKYLKHKKCVAIGEIGLDYHWDIPKDLQNRIFEEQLALSKELDVPVVIHDREAHGDTMALLRKYKPKGLMHCFSGSVELMHEVMRLGMSISLGGVVTFKNARHSVECAKEVPVERLLLETDAPYMSPVPKRGKRNDSRNIVYVAEKIAEVRGMEAQELLKITEENAKKLYNIDNKA